jgi:hypothetical protein
MLFGGLLDDGAIVRCREILVKVSWRAGRTTPPEPLVYFIQEQR